MKVEVVPYDPEWKKKYLDEAAKIKKACGDLILTIEHGGSTAIDGISAKPVVDIYVGVKKLGDADTMIPKMRELHYEYISKYEHIMPFRRFFIKNLNDQRRFHVHTTEASHTFRRDDLLFKDFLKINRSAFKEYEKLKIELAKQEWETSLDYNEAKTDFIKFIKAKALNYFSRLYEETESKATNLMHSFSTDSERRRAKFQLFSEDGITAIRTDVFPGFSLNRALGFEIVDNNIIDKLENFFTGKAGKYALQIPPYLLDDEKTKLLVSRGYNYANSWVTYYRDSNPVENKGTDLLIKEIGKEHSAEFAHIMNDIFGFPHEFDDIAASAVGQKDWVIYSAFDGEKTAGSAGICITGETAYLSFANVLPEYRKRGIQGELLSRRIDAARERGVKWLMVDTAENSDENPNPSYWNMLRHGFRLLYKRPNFVKINRESGEGS